MDVSISYKASVDSKIMNSVRNQAIASLEKVVRGVVDEYIAELEQHIGRIPGSARYTDGEVDWQPLGFTPGESKHNFWYETGETARSVVVNIRVTNKGITIFAGIPSTAGAYDKAIWNELGFTPEDGDHLIRRPLFIPIAETHAAELNRRVADFVKKNKLTITVPVK